MKELKDYLNQHDYTLPKSVCGKYEYIWAWGKSLGSMSYYIAEQVTKAIKDNAPEKAVFYSEDKERWITIDECCEKTQQEVNYILNK